MSNKTRYTDAELKEFRALIEEKNSKSQCRSSTFEKCLHEQWK